MRPPLRSHSLLRVGRVRTRDVGRHRLGSRNNMIKSLITVQYLLWVVPCMARPYLDQADFPLGKYLFDDQVRGNWCSDYFPHRLQWQVQDGDSHIFPQYQLVQIISRNPAILSDLENQLKKASGENEREEDTTNDLNFSLIFGCFYIYSAKKLGVRVSL